MNTVGGLSPTALDVVILCGGLGTRLRSVLSHLPKPMATINENPFLDILIRFMEGQGFRRFILCTGHMQEVILQYYREANADVTIIVSEEEMPLGTAGAVKNAEPLILSNPFIVMNGDSFCPVDMQDFLNAYSDRKAEYLIALTEIEDMGDYGTVNMDAAFKISSFLEKGKKGRGSVNAGIYLFQRDVFSLIPPGIPFSIEYDLFPKLLSRKMYGFLCNESLIDIGTPERYEHAKKIFGKGGLFGRYGLPLPE
ncbi:MAG: galactokinase [Thermodesulfovibrio sp.]|nr:galactokinase [Thermodesulfovibrio sp.]